jgi:DnaJ domain
MIYFGLGVLVLVIAIWLLRVFIEADPATLARSAGRLAIGLGAAVAIVLLLVLLATGRLGLVLAEVTGLAPIILRGWVAWRRRQAASGPPPGRTSEVETDYVRMVLDHDNGTMSGTVRRGPHQGRRLEELSRPELFALWRECRAEDGQGASLLEAYLDRLMPDWRAEAQRAGSAGAGGEAGSRAPDAMTRAEAYEVLGLSWGAGESDIREAHRRLMLKLHPDHGGSTYLAAKLNRAREILLAG